MPDSLETAGDAFVVMTTPPPELSADAISRVLREYYGIDGTVHVLASERDQNFLVERNIGTPCVLKIANPAEATAVTDFQIAALLHVAETDPGLPLPRVVRALDGSSRKTIVGEDDREHVVRVLTWLDGIPLGNAEPRPDNAADLGSALARLGVALQDFDHPASNYSLLWDIKGAENLLTLLGNIEDQLLSATCRRHLQRFAQYTKPALKNLRSQVIYNDLHASNVLVDPQDPQKISGIIDFGDIVKSPLIIDVAVASAYLVDDSASPLARIQAFLAGYSKVRPLQQDEVDLLYDLILTRNVMTIIISHWRAARYPDNREYVLRSEALARNSINTLKALGKHAVTRALSAPCLSSSAAIEDDSRS
jgi:hydroxylysine kinase